MAKFKEGDIVIFNEKYIRNRGHLSRGGYSECLNHIEKGNKPVTVITISKNTSTENPVYALDTPIYQDLPFYVREKEIKSVNNSIKKL